MDDGPLTHMQHLALNISMSGKTLHYCTVLLGDLIVFANEGDFCLSHEPSKSNHRSWKAQYLTHDMGYAQDVLKKKSVYY